MPQRYGVLNCADTGATALSVPVVLIIETAV